MIFILGCGHCKTAKPLYTNAAATFKDNPKVHRLFNLYLIRNFV
jgi:hypothetical protein